MRKNKKFVCVIALLIGRMVYGSAQAPQIGKLQFAGIGSDKSFQVIERAKRYGYSFNPKNIFKPDELVLVLRGNNTLTVGRISTVLNNGKYKIQVSPTDPKNPDYKMYKNVDAKFIGKFPKHISSQSAKTHDQKCITNGEKKLNSCTSTVNLHGLISPQNPAAQAKPTVAPQQPKQLEKKQKQGQEAQSAPLNHAPKDAAQAPAPQHRLQRQQSSRMLFDKNTSVTDKVIIAAQNSINLSQEVIEKIKHTKSFIAHNLPMNRERTNKDLSSLLKRALYYLHGATLELAHTQDKNALSSAQKAQAEYNNAKRELDSFLVND
jgi:hypothetical protein